MESNAGVPDSFTDLILKPPSAEAMNRTNRKAAGVERRARAFIEQKLSKRAQRFLYEYRRTGYNAAEAALLSNIAILPYAAHKLGDEEVRKPHMAKAIALMEELDAARTEFVLERGKYMTILDKIATHNVADFIERDADTGEPTLVTPDPSENPELFIAIAEIRVRKTTKGRGDNRETTTELIFKPHDKMKAIELLHKLDNEAQAAAVASAAYPANGAGVTAATWQPITFNIMPVPAGEFIPAPEPDIPQMRIVASAS